MNNEYKVIGKNFSRVGAAERLKGAPVFAADLHVGRPILLRALRSTKAHAKILGIDTEKARQLKGVVGIFTAKDIPGKNLLGTINKDHPLLATGKVRFIGDAIALIAAETETALKKALGVVKVTYEDLPAVFNPVDALKEEAAKIHSKGNLLYSRKIRKGNVKKAFHGCKAVVERTYRTAPLEHTYLEPDAGAGYVEEDGTFVIYASTQNPHYDHKEIVGLLGLENDQVRIIQAATGGGFGSKLDLNVQGFIGLGLYHLKRPLRYVYSREEAFLATAKRHPLTITMKTGADGKGNIKAMKARIVCDTGAYGSYGIAVASRSAVHATGPYEIENVEVDVFSVYTNKQICGAMRGFGVPQMAFAHESQLNLLAAKLGIDPLEIRQINALKEGSKTGTEQSLTASVGIGKCLEALKPQYEQAKKRWKYAETPPFQRRGIGIGAMFYGIGNTGVKNPAAARIEINPDGLPTLYTGCADIGQGSSSTLTQIAAEILRIKPDQIRIVTADTKLTANAGATSASRQTYISGNAVKDAAEKLAEMLLAEASDMLGAPKSSLSFDAGFVVNSENQTKKVPFSKLVDQAHKKGISLVYHGFFDPATVPLDPETGRGAPYATYAFACHMALVNVDALTGEVRVEKIVAAHDVGKAIYPEGVKGQIYGGVAMGIGFALMEEYSPGFTRTLKDYLIPTCADMPEVIPIIVESEEPSGPFGAKGVGEPALIPTAPAVLNAISDALGERIYSLPANLERVLKASIDSGCFGPKGDIGSSD
ncbi:MAG: xanthine dehydrogenase family protein molybdopterin-binding subunit [Desulfobacterales bacterium]